MRGRLVLCGIVGAVVGAGVVIGLALWRSPSSPSPPASSATATTAPSASGAPPIPAAPPPAAAASAPSTNPALPRLEARACPFASPAGRTATCADLLVAENRADPASRVLRLRLVIFKARGTPAGDDPIIFISGGPGEPAQIDAASVSRWWGWLDRTAWLGKRDLVVFDQRGVGTSEPDLSCPELVAAGASVFTTAVGLPAATQQWASATATCHARLRQAGITLENYSTASIVADLKDLLSALGHRSWNLFAVSYGTRVALDFLRDHPGGTRTAILDSVLPPDARSYSNNARNSARAFKTLFEECAEDSACNRANPHLAQAFERVVRKASTTPIAVQVQDAKRGGSVRALLDEAKLIETLFYGFYEWRQIRELPAVITALDRGDVKPLAALATLALSNYTDEGMSHGLFLSVECRDEYPFNTRDALEKDASAAPLFRAFALSNLPLMACPAWPVGRAAESEQLPTSSDVPVLMLSGDLDPVTPSAWAKAAAARLPRGTALSFRRIGHGVVASHACSDRLIDGFLTDPRNAPYDDCLLGLGAPRLTSDPPKR